MNYYNNQNIQYILSFPEPNYIDLNIIFKEEDKKELKISNRIALISTITTANSLFLKQCDNNSINYLKSQNDGILSLLLNIKEEYVLIVKNKDAIITNDLTEEFIAKFDSLKLPFVFASSPIRMPNNDLEGYRNLLVNQKGRFVNAMIMFGKKDEVIKFYLNLIDNENIEDEFIREHVKIRKTLMQKYDNKISYIDYNNLLFSTILKKQVKLSEKNGFREIEDNNYDTPIEEAIF